MKAFRSTGIFTVLVVLLAGYTAWEYYKAGSDADTDEVKKFFRIKNEDVQQIKITNMGQTTLIEREHDGWHMKQPVEDLVEPTMIDALLYSAGVVKGKVFDKAKVNKWSDYGLEPPGSSLEIKSSTGVQRIDVGSKNAFDGKFYVRMGDQLLIADRGLAQAVLRDPKGLRSRRLWRDPESEVKDVAIKMDFDDQKEDFKIVKNKEGKWTFDPAVDFPVDRGRLERWVAALESLMPNEIAADSRSDEESHNDLLVKPSYVLTVDYLNGGKAAQWILTIGQDKAEDVYMYTNQRPTVYKARVPDMSALRVPRKYFRDGKPPFQFPIEQAREIEVHAGDFKHTFKKSELVWKLADGSADEELDQDKLITMMQHLTALEAQEFLPKGVATGFKEDQKIIIRDGGGKTLFEMQWGSEYKAKQAFNKGMTFRSIKTNLEQGAMGVSAGRVLSLIDKTMIKRVAKK